MTWMMTLQDELINLNYAKRIYVSQIFDDSFYVEALMSDGDEHDLKQFDNKEEAIAYLNDLKHIFD